jgi:hypothetical protein
VDALVEKEHLHPIPPEDLNQVLKDLLYAFIGTGNPWKDILSRVQEGLAG